MIRFCFQSRSIVNIFLSWKVLVTVCPGGFPFCIEKENKPCFLQHLHFQKFFPLGHQLNHYFKALSEILRAVRKFPSLWCNCIQLSSLPSCFTHFQSFLSTVKIIYQLNLSCCWQKCIISVFDFHIIQPFKKN